jgi:hypothetical protein
MRLCQPFSAKENACRPQYVIGALLAKGLISEELTGCPPTITRCVSVKTHWGFRTGIAFKDGISVQVPVSFGSSKWAVRLYAAKRGMFVDDDDDDGGSRPPKTYRMSFRTMEQWSTRIPALTLLTELVDWASRAVVVGDLSSPEFCRTSTASVK